MNDSAQDMRKWTLISTDVKNKGSLFAEETTNTYLVPARLMTCTTRHGLRYHRATVSSATFDKEFPIKTAQEITCEDGERIVNVKITTITSNSRGCVNGHARLIAVEIEPDVWYENLFPFPY